MIQGYPCLEKRPYLNETQVYIDHVYICTYLCTCVNQPIYLKCSYLIVGVTSSARAQLSTSRLAKFASPGYLFPKVADSGLGFNPVLACISFSMLPVPIIVSNQPQTTIDNSRNQLVTHQNGNCKHRAVLACISLYSKNIKIDSSVHDYDDPFYPYLVHYLL